MDDFFDMDHVRALVYLNAADDNKNKVLLSNDQLCIIYKGKKTVLALDSIRQLTTANKKMLLPLLIGGIVTPFAFLSYFVNLFLPWVHLVSILLGMLLFYIGWNGRSTFIILLKSGEELIHYLPSISKNLIAFSNYTNDYLKDSKKTSYADLIVVEVDHDQEPALFGEALAGGANIFPMMGFTRAQYKRWKKGETGMRQFFFDPLQSGREIRFEYDSMTREMRPVIAGPILRSALIEYPSAGR